MRYAPTCPALARSRENDSAARGLLYSIVMVVYKKGDVYKKKNEQPGPKSFCCSSPLSTAVRTRLELATPCVTGMYSNLLNYRTSVLFAIVVSRLRVQSYEHFLILQNFAVKNLHFLWRKMCFSHC